MLTAHARHVAKPVVIGLVLVFAFTALYVTAYQSPRPRGLQIGVVGTPAQASAVQRGLDARADGAFAVRRYASESTARRALLDTQVPGVLIPGTPSGGVLGLGRGRVLVAQAYGVAPTEVLTDALRRLEAANGTSARVEDLRPLPAGDRRGLSSLFTVVGTLIPSFVFGVLLSVLGRHLPARIRWGAVVTFASVAGAVVAFNNDVLVGALTGDFFGVAAVAALLALAVSAVAHGLGHLGGPIGIGAAVALLMLLGVSSSGGAVGSGFEPGFYATISPLLPPGAALTAIRNVVYFDGAATRGPLLVLGAWAVAGLGFGLLGERLGPHVRGMRRPAPAAAS